MSHKVVLDSDLNVRQLLRPLRTNREAMLSVAGTENYNTLLLTQKGLKAVTQWLISQNALDQFRVAREW